MAIQKGNAIVIMGSTSRRKKLGKLYIYIQTARPSCTTRWARSPSARMRSEGYSSRSVWPENEANRDAGAHQTLETTTFLLELGLRLRQQTGEPRSKFLSYRGSPWPSRRVMRLSSWGLSHDGRSCAARVTVVVLCVCLSVCLFVCCLSATILALRGGL